MDKQEELLTEILKRVQRNYVHIVEVERLTKELGDSLSRNDQESAQLLLKMRQDEMDQIAEMKQEILMLLQAVDAAESDKIKAWLRGESMRQPDDFESEKVLEISCQIQQRLERIISLDKVINMKLAGKDSYYQSVPQ